MLPVFKQRWRLDTSGHVEHDSLWYKFDLDLQSNGTRISKLERCLYWVEHGLKGPRCERIRWTKIKRSVFCREASKVKKSSNVDLLSDKQEYVAMVENDLQNNVSSPHAFTTTVFPNNYLICFQILSSSCVLLVQALRYSHAYR